MAERRKRWPEIDNLYAMGTLMVILGHSHSSDWNSFSGTFLVTLINFLYVFHMPLFFFIAGFLLQNSNGIDRTGYGKWLLQKTVRLLTPYVVLSAAALIPKYYLEHSGFGGFTVGYLLQVLFVPRIGVWGHFWFLPVLLLLYTVLGAVSRLLNSGPAWVLAAGVTILLYFLPDTTDWLCFNDFRSAAVFFVGGMAFRRFRSYAERKMDFPLRLTGLASGLAASVLLVHWFYGQRVIMLLTAAVMIFACWQAAALLGERRMLRWLSEHTFTFYIYSWPAQAVAMAAASQFGLPWPATSAAMLVAGFAIPAAIVLIYGRAKCLQNRGFDLLLGMK